MPPTEDLSSVSDAFDEAISRFLAGIPQPPVQRAISGFLRALISGLQQDHFLKSVKFIRTKSSLEITLHSSVIGTVATRSRVPGEWLLLPRIQVSMDDNHNSITGTKLLLQGIQVVPIQGATEAWKDLAALFETSQADTLDEQRVVAWQWWDTSGRAKYKGTKLWRVVESLALLGFGQAVPTYAKASLLLGCCLGMYQDVPSLYFRCNDKNQVDVLGTLEPTEEARNPKSPKFNCNEELKDAIGLDLWEETISSSIKRATAAKCAPSSLNYAALFCARPDQEMGASPESVEKLVTVARCYGGASRVDVLRGKANSWQYDDETYQMTGNDGRIVWKPVDGNK
jgi:hypothetical protein